MIVGRYLLIFSSGRLLLAGWGWLLDGIFSFIIEIGGASFLVEVVKWLEQRIEDEEASFEVRSTEWFFSMSVHYGERDRRSPREK